MVKYYKYIIGIVSALLIGLIAWYFQSIISYILISAVLSFIGAPLVTLMSRIHYRRYAVPRWLSATVTLSLMWIITILFFKIFVPMLTSETQKLSAISNPQFLSNLTEPLTKIDALVNKFGLNHGKPFSSVEVISQKFHSIMDVGLFTDVFGSLATTVTNLFIAAFSISFITFFFLKDEGLFSDGILLFITPKYEAATREFVRSSKELLMRYFVGIGLQTLAIIILTAAGLYIVGLDLQTSLVIALFAGIINVIPYVGPVIATIFAVIIGLASQIQILPVSQLGPLSMYIVLVFIIIRVIDNFLFQTIIYSSSVKAHPLEIFLVILMAGHIAGITGMLVAIPGYTVIRVFAKQFLNNFAVVKKLTEKI